MRPRQKSLLLLASVRIANLPSVVSNVWLGILMGWEASQLTAPITPPWAAAAQLSLAGILLYVAGNFLNDWHDRNWDAQHRPERALPQGAFSPALYLFLAIFCGAAGVIVAGLNGPGSALVALTIALCVVIYTRWHKQAAWTVLVMGLCRGLLPLLFFIEWPPRARCLTATTLFGDRINLLAAFTPIPLALVLYVAGLSLLARCESQAAPPARIRWLARSMLVLSGLSMASVWLQANPVFGLLGLVPFALWLTLCFTRFGKSPRTQIPALLAGLPLLDWILMAPDALIHVIDARGICVHIPFPLTCLLLPPLAFVSGRLLQRVAAAT